MLLLKNVGDNQIKDTCVYSLPLYMLWRIKEYINDTGYLSKQIKK